MSGCRGLTDTEANMVLNCIDNKRDKCLFILGLKTGFRISELLSLKVGDVYMDGQVVDRIKVTKANMKGKTKAREVALHPQAKEVILSLILSMTAVKPELPLFMSRVGYHKPITRHMAHKLLKTAYSKAQLRGALATHTMRKSFATKVYTALKYDLYNTSKALGHSDIRNTVNYLEVNQAAIDAAILA